MITKNPIVRLLFDAVTESVLLDTRVLKYGKNF